MRVGVNTVSVEPGTASGDGLFLRKVLTKMREVQPSAEFVLLTDPRNHEHFDGWERQNIGVAADATGVGLNGISKKLVRAAQDAGVEIILSPLLNAPLECGLPLVVFLDELRALGEPNKKKRWFGGASEPPGAQICAEAHTIVVPSQFLRRQILERYGVPMDKVVVAPYGVDDVFFDPQPSLTADPYFLCMGDVESRSHLKQVLETYSILAEELPHSLIIAGRPWPGEPAEWHARVLRVEFAPQAQWAGLYQNCSLLLYAAPEDGSGVRVLEALKAGARTVAPRSGAIPEVAKDVPFYFDPGNTHSMITAIRRGLDETEQEAKDRIKFGRQLTREYTWEKCAWKTLSALSRA